MGVQTYAEHLMVSCTIVLELELKLISALLAMNSAKHFSIHV